jgi:hypothetical protein
MSLGTYWLRNVDAPAALIAVLAFTPYYGLAGFWLARKRNVEVGSPAGAVTAVLGYAIVSVTTIAYAAGTEPAPKSVAYVLYSITFLIPAAIVGATGGLVGGALAHSPAVRSPRSR